MFSCITSKTAQKNFNNAEFNTAAYKYQKLLKKGDSDINFLLAESYRKSNNLWKAEKYYNECLSIPLFPGISTSEAEYIVKVLNSIIK